MITVHYPSDGGKTALQVWYLGAHMSRKTRVEVMFRRNRRSSDETSHLKHQVPLLLLYCVSTFRSKILML